MKQIFIFSGPMMARIQYIALFASIVGAFFVTWNLYSAIVLIFFFYLYGVCGMSLMLHRYWSHKGFEFRNKPLEWFFTAISVVSARGSPLAWVHIHRQHHAHSDTDKDPHRPGHFSLFSFKSTYIGEMKLFLIKDLMTKTHKIIHEYYLLFIIAWCTILFLVSPGFLYFAWILPVCLNQISQDLWNYFSHVSVGYRNFDTNDNSRNVGWLWPLILGEAWHNNHHKSPKGTTKFRQWEIDPLQLLINIIKK